MKILNSRGYQILYYDMKLNYCIIMLNFFMVYVIAITVVERK